MDMNIDKMKYNIKKRMDEAKEGVKNTAHNFKENAVSMKDKVMEVSRTDLAIESVAGLEVDQEFIDAGYVQNEEVYNNVKVTSTKIPESLEERVGKKAGRYVTIDLKNINPHDHDDLKNVQKLLANEITEIINENNLDPYARVLVVGLGNDKVTPDALGPLVTLDVLVTNHIFELEPESIENGFRPVCALAPGVMGVTGIETYEIIDSVVKRVKPELVIVVDALASGAIERVNKTIQLSDYGINPGSGVGNNRKSISRDSLGVPVISIGVPTVVDATTLVKDSLISVMKYIGHTATNERPMDKIMAAGTSRITQDDLMKQSLPNEEVREKVLGQVGLMDEAQIKQLMFEVLTPIGLNMMVTPKEIDEDIVDLADIIARAINIALHEQIK